MEATKAMRRAVTACVVLLLVSGWPCLARAQWREVPVKGGEDTAILSFALAADGTPWAVFDKPEPSLCRFDNVFCPSAGRTAGLWAKNTGKQWTIVTSAVALNDAGPNGRGQAWGHFFLAPTGNLYCTILRNSSSSEPA